MSVELSPLESGIAAHQLGQYKQALVHYAAAVLADPNDAIVYQLRGSVYLELKRFLDALKEFNEAIALSPYNEVGYLGKGRAFVGLKDYRWAVTQFTRAMELLPDDAPELAALYLDRAEAYQLMGEPVSAEKDRNLAQSIAGTDAT